MGSKIDASQPADGAFSSKVALRASLAAAKGELEHGGFVTRAAATGARERTVADQLLEIAYNVREFGAKGDDTYLAAAASITSGTTTLTVTGAVFVADDVGKWVYVAGAGYSGAGLAAKIAGVTNPPSTTVELDAMAGATVADADFWYYTDDSSAFTAAISAINASGRPGRLVVPQPAGLSYRIAQVQIVPLVDIEVVGIGRVRLKCLDNRAATVGGGDGRSNERMWWISHSNTAYETRKGYTPWVTTRNIIFDGNRDRQVESDGTPWTGGYGLQYATCVYVDGITDVEIKQPASFVDCEFVETSGDGLGMGRNCRVELTRCRTYNCFRGGVVNLGFHNELIAQDCETDDDLKITPGNFAGLFWEQENYSSVIPNTGLIIIDGWIFRQGSINLSAWGYIGGQATAVDDTSHYVLNRVVVDKGNRTDQVQIAMIGQGTCLISDSLFYGGRMANLGTDPYGRNAANGFNARTCLAGNMEVVNTRFIASNNGLPVTDPTPTFYAAVRIWDTNDNNRVAARLRFKGCTFGMDETCHAQAPVYAVFDEEMDVRWGMTPIAGGTPPPYLELTDCSFEPLTYFATPGDPPSDYTVRLFDWLYYGQEGQSAAFRGCGGVGANGFRFNPTRSKPTYARFEGGDYILSGALLDINPPLGLPDLDAVLWFRDFHQDCRYNDLAGGNYGNLQTYNGRTIYVDGDPTAAGPVSVTGRVLYQGLRYHGRYMGRLEHGGITAGSVTITRTLYSDGVTTVTLTDSDNGDGTGDLLEGATVVGTIVYATGWYDFKWDTAQTDLNDTTVVDYTHGNQTPGFLGDVAVLKSDPAQRWRCTTASATSATWQAL